MPSLTKLVNFRKYLCAIPVSLLIFLLWPRSFYHYTYKSPCPYVTNVCEYKEVSPKWRLGGGLDVICSPDAFKYKRSGLRLTQVHSCFETRDETWGSDSGHYYIGKSFNILYPLVGSFIIGSLTVAAYIHIKSRTQKEV